MNDESRDMGNNWIQDTERRQTKQKTKKIQNILKMIRAVFTLFQNPFFKI
jgi:hypothetical protein